MNGSMEKRKVIKSMKNKGKKDGKFPMLRGVIKRMDKIESITKEFGKNLNKQKGNNLSSLHHYIRSVLSFSDP